MSKQKSTKEPIHIERADKKFDRDKFADKMADAVIDAVSAARKRKGLPPLKP